VTLNIFHIEVFLYPIALASGRKQSVPYSAMAETWEDFINPVYLPPGVPFMEISRYKGADTHRILVLWRERQDKGEVAFKFDHYVGPEKEPTLARYDDMIFEGLMAAGNGDAQISFSGIHGDEDEDEEEEGDEEQAPWPRHSCAADPSDEDESEESETVGQLTDVERENEAVNEDQQESHGRGGLASIKPRPRRTALSPTYDDPPRDVQKTQPLRKRPRARRQVIESEEDDNTRTTPQTRQEVLTLNLDSSPTLAGSSPLIQKPTRRHQLSPTKALQRKVLPTPESSQTSTPVPPEGSRGLRSGTRAIAEAKEALANTTAKEAKAAELKTRSKGKMKEGGSRTKEQKKRG